MYGAIILTNRFTVDIDLHLLIGLLQMTLMVNKTCLRVSHVTGKKQVGGPFLLFTNLNHVMLTATSMCV